MLAIYKMYINFGRMGELDGVFVAESSEIDDAIGQEIQFGEVLGKYSDVSVILELEHVTMVNNDPKFVNKFIEIMGTNTVSGYNPLDYI